MGLVRFTSEAAETAANHDALWASMVAAVASIVAAAFAAFTHRGNNKDHGRTSGKLDQMVRDVAEMKADVAEVRTDIADVKADVRELRGDARSDRERIRRLEVS